MIRDWVMGTRILEEPQAKPTCKDAARQRKGSSNTIKRLYEATKWIMR